jgi:hypothetical protein
MANSSNFHARQHALNGNKIFRRCLNYYSEVQKFSHYNFLHKMTQHKQHPQYILEMIFSHLITQLLATFALFVYLLLLLLLLLKNHKTM